MLSSSRSWLRRGRVSRSLRRTTARLNPGLERSRHSPQVPFVPLPAVSLKEIPLQPAEKEARSKPLLRTADLNRGESEVVELADGTRAHVKLLDVEEDRDGVRSAIRQARVTVDVNGRRTTLGRVSCMRLLCGDSCKV